MWRKYYQFTFFPSEISVNAFSDDNAENVSFENNQNDLQTLNTIELFIWPCDTSSSQPDWDKGNDRDVGKESARAIYLRYNLSCTIEGKNFRDMGGGCCKVVGQGLVSRYQPGICLQLMRKNPE